MRTKSGNKETRYIKHHVFNTTDVALCLFLHNTRFKVITSNSILMILPKSEEILGRRLRGKEKSRSSPVMKRENAIVCKMVIKM